MQRVAIGLLLGIVASSAYAATASFEVPLSAILGLLGIGLAGLGLVDPKKPRR